MKTNRISRKARTAAKAAQAKRPHPSRAKSAKASTVAPGAETRNLTPIYGHEIGSFDGQRLFRDGPTYYLVSDYNEMDVDEPGTALCPGQTVLRLNREQARAWLDAEVIGAMIPHEFQRDFRHRWRGRADSATPDLTLGELLSEDSIDGLNRLGAEGVSVAAQVAGAVASWLRYAEWLRDGALGGFDAVKAAPGILECEHYEHVHAEARGSFIDADGVKLYQELIARARQMPLAEAAAYLEGLAGLIEYHPALADEVRSLREFLDGACLLGRSSALRASSGDSLTATR